MHRHSITMERHGHIRIQTTRGHCLHCEQPHALDISYHCVGCDGEVCALCYVVVRETSEAWCPECAPEPADGREPAGAPSSSGRGG